MISDAQVHIWGADTPDRPWPKIRHSYAHRDTPFGVTGLVAEMDAAWVDRAVIVPPSWEGDRDDLAQEACRLHPRGWLSPRRTPSALTSGLLARAGLRWHANVLTFASEPLCWPP